MLAACYVPVRRVTAGAHGAKIRDAVRSIARLVVPLLAVVALVAAAGAQTAIDSGIRGYVFTHEDQPVSSGAIVLQRSHPASTINATIDNSGYFGVVTTAAGLHHLSIAVPGFATHHVNVIVPRSRSVNLPPIRLSVPTYYHARFVNADGDTIVSPRLRMRAVGADSFSLGRTIDTLGLSKIESDGSITVGPLPRGVLALAIDMPNLAQTRLPDITVTGEESLLERGTMVIQPGSLLQVELVDLNGTPIPNQLVTIEDLLPASPLSFPPARTDEHGRATFDRLAAGDYRVSAQMLARCSTSPPMSVVRAVRAAGNGVARVRLVLGGDAAVRVLSPFGAVGGVPVSVTAGRGEHLELARMRLVPVPRRMFQSSCHGSTNADGLVTFNNIPGGPFTVEVRRGNSTFVRNVEFRGDGRETRIAIPGGLLSLRVTNAADGRPIANARVTWSGAGYRVMATATGNGEVLLEGVGEAAGSVSVNAPGFVEGTANVAPASAPIEIAVAPLPRSVRRLRVVTKSGEPIENAIVQLLPPTVLDIGVIGVTDANGVVVFTNVPPREARVRVSAEGYVPSAIALPANSDASVEITLVAASPGGAVESTP
jgi:hypothetical protein